MNRLLLLLLFLSTNSYAGWITDYESAQKLALGTDRLILVDFWASWCGPCKKMDAESWSDPGINDLMANFVALKVDIDRERNFAQKYGVSAIPFIFIMDAHGEVLYKSRGYMDRNEVQKVLEKYALNTNFLQRESLNFFRDANYSSSIRMAQRYLDFSLYLKEGVRKDFLNVAANYLKLGKRFLDKDQENFELMNQKVELLDLNIDLYQGRYDRVARQLEKMDTANVMEHNISLYVYLNYCLAVSKKDEQALGEWEPKLRTNQTFSKKSQLFLGK